MINLLQSKFRRGVTLKVSGDSNPLEGFLAADCCIRAGLVSPYSGGVWVPAQQPADPVCPFPLSLMAVAGKPPATRTIKANDVGRGAGAAADSVVLAYRSFQF